jgi:hypothetical protein
MRENALEEPRMGELSSATPAEPAKPGMGRALREGPDLERRYPLALAMYALLAALVWFTMDSGKVEVLGRPVELRLVPLIVIGGLALRTVLARHAEGIRRSGEKGGS